MADSSSLTDSICISVNWTQFAWYSESWFQNPHRTYAIQVAPYFYVSNIREFSPGKVAILSRSGTLCYETVAATTKQGLGQSTVIGIGGDRMPGTSYVDALKMLQNDASTEGILLPNLRLISTRNYTDWRGWWGR